MRTTEHTPQSAVAEAGLFAALSDSLRGGGTGASSLRLLAPLALALAALALTASPALAVKEYVPGATFGAPGSEAGQLSAPEGVAVNDSSGDVYVADTGNHRIDEFDPSKPSSEQFVRAWGWGVADGLTEELQVCSPLSCFAGLSGSGAGEFNTASGVAVDNSSGAFAQDVYVLDPENRVIDRFSATGELQAQITGTCPSGVCSGAEAFEELHGLTVDSSGDLWVYQRTFPIVVDEFGPTGVFVKAFTGGEHGAGTGLALDSKADVFVVRGLGSVAKYESGAGPELTELGTFDEGAGDALAVNSATDNLLVDQGGELQLFGPFGEPSAAPLQTFPAEPLSESHGVAVDGSSGVAYATQRAAGTVASFDFDSFPEAAAVPPADLSEGSVTLRGAVDPEGHEVTSCQFEYGTEPGVFPGVVPCEPLAPFTGATSVALAATVTGLEPRLSYHFRLTVVIAGSNLSSQERSFFTSTKPVIENESLATGGSTQATLRAEVNAAGLSSSYQVQYGTADVTEHATALTGLGASRSVTAVLAHLDGLTPSTEYRYRFLASNAYGETLGPEATFTTGALASGGASSCPNRTFSGFDASLPDCRAYELASANDSGEVDVPAGEDSPIGGGEAVGFKDIAAEIPQRAAADGDSVAYVAQPGAGGNGNGGQGLGNQFLATRDPQHGWQVATITPDNLESESVTNVEFESFSPDLSLGALWSSEPALADRAQPRGPTPCHVLYSRTAGAGTSQYHALFTETTTPGHCGFAGNQTAGLRQALRFAGGNEGAPGVAQYSHLIFQTPAPLTPDALESPPVTQQEDEEGKGGDNLYESLGGELQLINVLPGGAPDPNAVFGSTPESPELGKYSDLGGAISADGSRILWSDVSSGDLYVREHTGEAGAVTVPVSPGAATFMGASPQGATPAGYDVFYSEGAAGEQTLWRFDFERYREALDVKKLSEAQALAEAREQLLATGLSGEKADVRGVLGVSRDGSFVYFVAGAVLAENENAQHAKASLGEDNLYVLHEGRTEFIATLTGADDSFERDYFSTRTQLGDWLPDVGERTAQVTPDGRALVFMSTSSLTGYASGGAFEVYAYQAGAAGSAGTLFCASCSPSGASLTPGKGASFLPVSFHSSFMRRWISDDGSRVFFDTAQPLVPHDSNGRQDVYEWEREGTAGCPTATSRFGGCVSLISGGDSSDVSFFLDADATGDNVFFTTRPQLTAQDTAGQTELYDARVNGGFPQTSTACTGSGCQGAPPAPPGFATPASTTFSGAGNYPPPKPKTAAEIRAEHLTRALKQCRRKHNHHKRTVCEKQARKKYGRKSSSPRRPK